MKPRWLAAPISVGLLAAMLPGVAAADGPFEYYVEAGCLDGGRGPQFMDLTGTFPSLDAWRSLARDVESAAIPDSGEIDGLCSPDTIVVFAIERIAIPQAGGDEASIDESDTDPVGHVSTID